MKPVLCSRPSETGPTLPLLLLGVTYPLPLDWLGISCSFPFHTVPYNLSCTFLCC